MPHLANFRNHVKIEIGNYDFVFIATGLRDDLSARIAEVTLAVELTDAPRFFPSHTVDRTDKISVGHGVGRLLEFPKVFGEPGYRCGRIEDDLRSVQAENARSFRKV